MYLLTLAKNTWETNKVFVIGSLLSITCFIYVFHGTFLWLYERYTNPDSHYSHGFMIPIVTGFFIWRKREQLRTMVLESSKAGLLMIILALLVHIVSTWIHVYFLSGFSIMLLISGSSLYLYGVNITKKISFPLGLLLFMFPLPMQIIDAFSFPLKLFVADVASAAIKMAGIPLLREGAVIHLAKTSLAIGDPCSGIRSLISLLALGAIMAYLTNETMWKRTVIFASSIPIAILTNIVRVCALILAANWLGGNWASPEHWFHTTSGMGVFALSMILLFLVMRVFEWKK